MIRSKLALVVAFLAPIIFVLFNSGSGTEKMTNDSLIEQVRGDAIHWNTEGKRPEFWDSSHHRYFDRICKSFAIKELGRRGQDSKEVVSELISLFKQHDDWNSGDGILNYRSDIARTLGMINDPRSIAPMIDLIRERASTPDAGRGYGGGDLRWHDESVHYDDGRGCGPEGISEGLMLFSAQHHPEILARLIDLKNELETMSLPNQWAKKSVAKAITFFDSPPSPDKAGDVDYLKIRNDLVELE